VDAIIGIDSQNQLAVIWLSFNGSNDLQMLPLSIGDLSQLEKLDLRGCFNLTTLPENIFSR
jgi:hypothetical protein